MKKLLAALFIVRVMFPMNVTTYNNVESFGSYGEQAYELRLVDGRRVIVPRIFTVIEEKR